MSITDTETGTGAKGDKVFDQSATLTFINGSGASVLYAGSGTVLVQAGAGGGVYYAGSGDDSQLTAGTGKVVFYGGASGDMLTAAGAANDTMIAGAGNEMLLGGTATGALTIQGGSGNDMMKAGAGRTDFTVGTGNDIITDGGIADAITITRGHAGGLERINNFRVGVIWIGYVGGALLALGLLAAVTNWVYAKLRTASAPVRIAIIIFVVVPAFFVALTVLIALFSNYAALVLRCLFLTFAILIPPGLYYLFIATRRDSLLNAYVSSLSRLGLLRCQGSPRPAGSSSGTTVEAENERVRRVRGYIERFEALYGKLPEDYVPKLIEATREPHGVAAPDFPSAPGVASYVDLKTMLPVVSAVMLSAIGWFIVLPPSQESFITAGGTQISTGALSPPAATASSAGAPAPSISATKRDAGATATPAVTATSWSTALRPDVSPVAFAFVGSYFFAIQMLLRRFVRRDLGPNAYNDISARMILSIIGVWVLQQGAAAFGLGAQPEYLYVFAFIIGVFPQMIWQLITASIKRFKYLSIAIPNLTASMPLSVLEGLSVWHQARLEEEDIENIPNLAMADVVELVLTTKFPPHRIIDWIDQALLRTILGDQDGEATRHALSATLRGYGVRTATTLVAFCMQKGDDGQPILELLPATDRPRIRTLAAAVSTAPNLPLVQTWLGLQTNSLDEVFGPINERTAPAAEGSLRPSLGQAA